MPRSVFLPRWVSGVFFATSVWLAVHVTMWGFGVYFDVPIQGFWLLRWIKNLRAAGFHPNWRTVLFSTIMLVVLICWPRKFKKLSRYLPSWGAGLLITLGLNLLLNPVSTDTNHPELGTVFPGLAPIPLLSRIPLSVLAMLCIYYAWDWTVQIYKRLLRST
jgi:MFS superfamily sulfate permease-like transporter